MSMMTGISAFSQVAPHFSAGRGGQKPIQLAATSTLAPPLIEMLKAYPSYGSQSSSVRGLSWNLQSNEGVLTLDTEDGPIYQVGERRIACSQDQPTFSFNQQTGELLDISEGSNFAKPVSAELLAVVNHFWLQPKIVGQLQERIQHELNRASMPADENL